MKTTLNLGKKVTLLGKTIGPRVDFEDEATEREFSRVLRVRFDRVAVVRPVVVANETSHSAWNRRVYK